MVKLAPVSNLFMDIFYNECRKHSKKSPGCNDLVNLTLKECTVLRESAACFQLIQRIILSFSSKSEPKHSGKAFQRV